MTLIQAANELADVANSPDASFEDAMEVAREVLAAADAEPDALDGALRILLAAVRAEDDERAGIGATLCGALVERGADASLAVEHVVERFVEVVKLSARYVDACRDYFQNEILSEDAVCEICGPEDDEQDIMMPEVRIAVSEAMPEGESAWIALDLFCRPTVSMLTRDVETRRAMATDVEFVNVMGALAAHQPGAFFVWALLSLLDDEALVVLEPAAKKGWEVRIEGVADNFQLHLLLANALISGGYIEAEPVEEHVLKVVTGEGPPLLDEHVMAYWNLYNWTALTPDGQLPDGYFDQGAQHWIWNEGLPADIRQIDGQRVVLLGPTPVLRQWRPARLFENIKATLTLERELSDDDLAQWLQRIQTESSKARLPGD